MLQYRSPSTALLDMIWELTKLFVGLFFLVISFVISDHVSPLTGVFIWLFALGYFAYKLFRTKRSVYVVTDGDVNSYYLVGEKSFTDLDQESFDILVRWRFAFWFMGHHHVTNDEWLKIRDG